MYPFAYRHCYDCDSNLTNSVYYKEYLQSDQGSASVFRQINKIVSSSTEFKQLAGCASAQFSANWALEITWLDVEDYYSEFSMSGISDTEHVSPVAVATLILAAVYCIIILCAKEISFSNIKMGYFT